MLARFNGNVVPFADDATSTNRTVFGGITQSDAIDDNLNADFKKGWEIVGLNDNPTREDFNAMGYTLSALTAYLYEMGISEWNASQNYRTNSRTTGSDGKIYKSLTGTIGIPNVGNNPTSDAVNWELEFKNFVDLINNQTIAGIKTFSSNPISTATQSTAVNALTRKDYVDGLNNTNVKRSANLSDLENVATARTNLGLGTAAMRNVGTSSGNVMEVGAFGLGTGKALENWDKGVFAYTDGTIPSNFVGGISTYSSAILSAYSQEGYGFLFSKIHGGANDSIMASVKENGMWRSPVTLHHTGNILQTTGNSADFPMSQKAVSDRLFGVGQTWQDVTASRSVGVTYTNTTGKAIQLWFGFTRSTTGWNIYFTIDGSVVSGAAGYCPIIPPGGTYSIYATGITNIKWLELR